MVAFFEEFQSCWSFLFCKLIHSTALKYEIQLLFTILTTPLWCNIENLFLMDFLFYFRLLCLYKQGKLTIIAVANFFNTLRLIFMRRFVV